MATGHVFVVHGDLWQISSDALLVPSDYRLNITGKWRDHLPPIDQIQWESGEEEQISQSFTVPGTKTMARVVSVGSDEKAVRNDDTLFRWFEENVSRALGLLIAETKPSVTGRAIPLITVPVMGVGDGGFGGYRGEIVRRLLGILEQKVSVSAVDIALVCYESADFAAAQSLRRRGHRERAGQQPDELMAELVGLAKADRLVLFIGAGVSAAAGAPDWAALLRGIGSELEFDEQTSQFAGYARLGDPDRATVLRKLATSQGKDFDELLAQQLDKISKSSLGHSLLASMGMSEVVTTNYDALFESAADHPYGGRLKVLPSNQRPGPKDKWLLKLNGDVLLKSYVLSRSDFETYDDNRRPLASIVQAQLLTRHMLFVGFSMRDDNLIRLASDVGRFLDAFKSRVGPIGTVLSAEPVGAMQELWSPYLQFHRATVPGTDPSQADLRPWFRANEIFLDELLQWSTPSAGYLLDRRYEQLLGAEDHRLARLAHALGIAISDGERKTDRDDGWASISKMLNDFGM